MARSINKVILIGHVGKDPEIRYTQGGAPVANFSLATNETWSGQTGEKQERTDWHKIVAWRGSPNFPTNTSRKAHSFTWKVKSAPAATMTRATARTLHHRNRRPEHPASGQENGWCSGAPSRHGSRRYVHRQPPSGTRRRQRRRRPVLGSIGGWPLSGSQC